MSVNQIIDGKTFLSTIIINLNISSISKKKKKKNVQLTTDNRYDRYDRYIVEMEYSKLVSLD